LAFYAKAARHLFVIGGGYVGCELAAIYRDFDSRVTIAEAQPRLLPNWDPVAGGQIRHVLLDSGIDVLFKMSQLSFRLRFWKSFQPGFGSDRNRTASPRDCQSLSRTSERDRSSRLELATAF
jgi:hypothetical protein